MNQDFNDVQVFSGEPQEMSMTPAVTARTALASVEQARAVSEVQAAMLVAKMQPRDENRAYLKIMKACKRRSLAEQAGYAYKRGGTLIDGPSIRLAEVAASAWGNMTYGLRELNRSHGVSDVEAFAWDLESNTRVTRSFQVRHLLDTQKGTKELTAERDIYELMANMGQRRVRACIFEIIPGDIVEAAYNECKKTLAKGDGRPLEDRVRDMIAAFDELGVTQEMIESYLGHKVTAVVPAQLIKLTQIYRSLKDGVATREQFFTLAPEKEESQDKDEPRTEAPKKGKKETAEPASKLYAVCPEGGPKANQEVKRNDCDTCAKFDGCPSWE